MQFKKFMEAIETPPHMPKIFYEKYLEIFKSVYRTSIKLLSMKEFDRTCYDLLSRKDYWNIYELLHNIPHSLKSLEFIISSLEYALTTKDSDKELKRTLNEKMLMEIDSSAIEESISVLKEELGASEELDFVIKSFKEIKRFQDSYRIYYNKTKAYIETKERQYADYFNGGKSMPPFNQTEVLYHATTAVNSILKNGFKTREELKTSALGGGPSNLISFTSDIQIAEAIVWALRRAVEICTGKMNYKQFEILAKRLGNYGSVLDYMNKSFGKFNNTVEWIFQAFRTLMAFQDRLYDPVFANVTSEDFKNINPREIGIVASEVDMSQVGEYLSSMEEYRVPVKSIIKSWKVPYKGVF